VDKKSLKDLKAINDYIARDSTFYAERFMNKLIRRVDQLMLFPESGRVVPEVDSIDCILKYLYHTRRSSNKIPSLIAND